MFFSCLQAQFDKIRAAIKEDAYHPLVHTKEWLHLVLNHQATRKVSKNLELSFEGTLYQIQGMGTVIDFVKKNHKMTCIN